MSKYIKGSLGWLREKAKEYGFGNNIREFIKWAREKGIIVNSANVRYKEWEKTLKNAECKTIKEYLDKCAQNAGFKDRAERLREYNHETGIHIPIEECDNPLWFGYISENYVMKTFEDPIKTPPNNPGFDWKCKKGEKIDHKGACLQYTEGRQPFWFFNILYNNIADYYILSAWDSIDSLTPLHVWIFHKDEIIRGRKFWKRNSLTITNTLEGLAQFEKYEFTDRLYKLKELCNQK